MQPSARSGDPDEVKHDMQVPNSQVGSVIGRGGEKIRDIQMRSGAHVDIAKEYEARGQPTRRVTLTGRAECVARAQQIIEGIIAAAGERGSAGGGSGTGSDRMSELGAPQLKPYRTRM